MFVFYFSLGSAQTKNPTGAKVLCLFWNLPRLILGLVLSVNTFFTFFNCFSPSERYGAPLPMRDEPVRGLGTTRRESGTAPALCCLR
jgi:hypothetical protein